MSRKPSHVAGSDVVEVDAEAADSLIAGLGYSLQTCPEDVVEECAFGT